METDDFQNALKVIREHPERYFKHKARLGYVCPICKNGTGKTKTGVTEDPKHKNEFQCFKCGTYGDVIDFIEKEQDCDWNTAFLSACELNGIDTKSFKNNTDNTHYTHNTYNTHKEEPMKKELTPEEQAKEQAKKQAIADTIEEAQKHLEETNYFIQRGLSLDNVKKFNLGYLKDWRPEDKPNAPTSPRLIIPTSKTSYLARDVRQNLTDVQKQYSKQKSGEHHLFNKKDIKDTEQPCFIVEGEFDALSIKEVGLNAIGLGGTTNIRRLVKYIDKKIDEKKQITSLIIMLDNDEAGIKAAKELEEKLIERKLDCLNICLPNEIIVKDKPMKIKDANEFLIADRVQFYQYLAGVKDNFSQEVAEQIEEREEEFEKEKNDYIKTNNTSSYLEKFLDDLNSDVDTPYIPTGFRALDKILDGGFYEGLYIIGALSSLGKTTFILQIADNIAKSGQDVLIFSLEMARTELMAKSISRETALYCLSNNLDIKSNAKTVRGITVKNIYKGFTVEEQRIRAEAIANYRPVTKHLFISEGVGDISVKKIEEAVDKHIKFTGNKPLVIVDYLQIIPPETNQNKTDKQLVDYNITSLKRLSRTKKIPVVGISSFNRDNYTQSVSMSAFKESGSIEYSSDVLLGLQLYGIEDKKQGEGQKQNLNNFIEQAKAQNPRQIELKVLKNRNGATSGRDYFNYYPKFNYFEEIEKDNFITQIDPSALDF